MDDVVLSVKDLRISFKTNSGLVKAARGVSFDLKKNKTLAIVGESGSGKSVTSKAIMGILESNSVIEQGQIIYNGEDLLRIRDKTFNKIRGSEIAIIFQDTMSTLNPIMKVGLQVLESLIKKEKKTKEECKTFIKCFPYLNKERKQALLKGSVKEYLNIYPNDLSILNSLIKSINNEYNSLKAKLLDFVSEYFEINKFFDVDKAYKDYLSIYKKYKNLCVFNNGNVDRYSSSYLSVIQSLFISMKKSYKDIKKREKLFEKYPESNADYFELPKDVKANNREVIVEPIYFYNRIKEEIFNFVNKIDEKHIKLFEEENYEALIDSVKFQLKTINKKIDKEELKTKVLSLLKEVGIKEPETVYNQYPFELSGGMRQRIAIIIAISMEPKVLICDEPTTSLDVTIQGQILNLIEEVKERNHLSVIFITHDLGVVSRIADEVVAMYAGKVLEKGTVFDIFYDPRHPYTWSLLSAIPENNVDENFISIKGNVSSMIVPLKGDAFAYRSDYALKQDTISFPEEHEISKTHSVYSHLYHSFANEVTPPEIVIERIRKSLKANPINIPEYTNKKNSILEILKKEGSI